MAAARRLYVAGEREAALTAWPGNVTMERRVLEALVRTGHPRRATRAVDKPARRLYLSAAQSALFNAVLARRVRAGTHFRLLTGDVAVKHTDSLRLGGMFLVEDPEAEQPRAQRWEISPTGPMFGRKIKAAAEDAAGIELESAAALGVRIEDFDTETGARRPLRVRPTDTTLAAGTDDHGPHITVAFSLPAGSFATVLLRELMKSG